MGGWVEWVMGIGERSCDEHRVLCVSVVESLNCTPNSDITLSVN